MRTAGSYRAARRNAARAVAQAKHIPFHVAFRPGVQAKVLRVDDARRNPSDHPGANPRHDPAGRQRWTAKVPNPALTSGFELVKMRGPRNPSRWLPHSSNREAERWLRRMG